MKLYVDATPEAMGLRAAEEAAAQKAAEEEADDSLFHIPLNGVIVMNLVTIP